MTNKDGKQEVEERRKLNLKVDNNFVLDNDDEDYDEC